MQVYAAYRLLIYEGLASEMSIPAQCAARLAAARVKSMVETCRLVQPRRWRLLAGAL